MPSTASGLIDTIRLKVDNSALTDTQILDIINNAQREVIRQDPLRYTETFTSISVTTAASSLQTITLPTDLSTIIQLYNLVSGEYHPVEYREDLLQLVADYAGATAAKELVWWSAYGNTGYGFPQVSSTLNTVLFYTTLPADFTSVTGSNALLNRHPEVLEYAALSEYYDALGENTRSIIWQKRATEALKDYLQAERSKIEDAREPIPKTPGTIYRGG